MAQIEFQLEVFTGPLDLLLHLISKHELNINDIQITTLLEQYLLYMQKAAEQDLELAGEFLEMAARLVYIKTVSLLPKPEEAERAKQELQGALIEYALWQEAARRLKEQFLADEIFTCLIVTQILLTPIIGTDVFIILHKFLFCFHRRADICIFHCQLPPLLHSRLRRQIRKPTFQPLHLRAFFIMPFGKFHKMNL